MMRSPYLANSLDRYSKRGGEQHQCYERAGKCLGASMTVRMVLVSGLCGDAQSAVHDER